MKIKQLTCGLLLATTLTLFSPMAQANSNKGYQTNWERKAVRVSDVNGMLHLGEPSEFGADGWSKQAYHAKVLITEVMIHKNQVALKYIDLDDYPRSTKRMTCGNSPINKNIKAFHQTSIYVLKYKKPDGLWEFVYPNTCEIINEQAPSKSLKSLQN